MDLLIMARRRRRLRTIRMHEARRGSSFPQLLNAKLEKVSLFWLARGARQASHRLRAQRDLGQMGPPVLGSPAHFCMRAAYWIGMTSLAAMMQRHSGTHVTYLHSTTSSRSSSKLWTALLGTMILRFRAQSSRTRPSTCFGTGHHLLH